MPFILLILMTLLAALVRKSLRCVHRVRHHRALMARWSAPETFVGNDRSLPALRLGIVGDSLSEMGPPVAANVAAQDWLDRGLFSSVTLVNRAVPMSRTYDWTPSSATGFIWSALESFRAEGVTHVAVRLGTNDCIRHVSPRQFRRNLSRIIKTLNRSGFVVWMDYVPYMEPKTMPVHECVRRLEAYNAVVFTLANGKNALLGNTLSFGLRDRELFLEDGIHFSEAGLIAFGRSQAKILS